MHLFATKAHAEDKCYFPTKTTKAWLASVGLLVQFGDASSEFPTATNIGILELYEQRILTTLFPEGVHLANNADFHTAP